MTALFPTLAISMTESPLGPAPTLVGMALAAYWAWALFKRHPMVRPHYRLVGVLLLVCSLSMLLGFQRRDEFAFGGYGGIFGRFVAENVAALNLTTLALIGLSLAVAAAVPLATDWLFVPLYLRLQEAQYRAQTGGGALAYAGSMAYSAREEDSTVDNLPSESTSTATLEPPPADESAGQDLGPRGVYEENSDEMVYRLAPEGGEGEGQRALAEPKAGEPVTEPDAGDADVPWYARRRAAREAARRERERELAESTSTDADAATGEASTLELTSNLAEDVLAFTTERPADRDVVVSPEAPEELDVPEAPDAPDVARAPESLASLDVSGWTGEAPAARPEPALPEPEASYADARELTAPPEQDDVVVEPEAELAAAPIPPIAAIEPEAEREPESGPDPAVEFALLVASDDERQSIEPAVSPEASSPDDLPFDPDPPGARAPEVVDPDRALYLAAGDLVVDGQRASISFLQRTLSIGYFQAAKLLDRLEKDGVIGPYSGAVSRKVTIDASAWERKKHEQG